MPKKLTRPKKDKYTKGVAQIEFHEALRKYYQHLEYYVDQQDGYIKELEDKLRDLYSDKKIKTKQLKDVKSELEKIKQRVTNYEKHTN